VHEDRSQKGSQIRFVLCFNKNLLRAAYPQHVRQNSQSKVEAVEKVDTQRGDYYYYYETPTYYYYETPTYYYYETPTYYYYDRNERLSFVVFVCVGRERERWIPETLILL